MLKEPPTVKTKLLLCQNSSYFYCACYYTKRWALLSWKQLSKKHCCINHIWIALDLSADLPILRPVAQLKFSHVSCKDASENGSRNKCMRSSLSSSCNSCRTQQCLKWLFEILGSYILISNYDLQSQIIFLLVLRLFGNEIRGRKTEAQFPGAWLVLQGWGYQKLVLTG